MVCTAGTLIGFRTQRPCVSSYRLQRYMFLGESPNVLPIFLWNFGVVLPIFLWNFGVVLPIFLGNFAVRILCVVPDSFKYHAGAVWWCAWALWADCNPGSDRWGSEPEMLCSLHMAPSAFGAFVTWETRRADAIATSITYPPGPVLWELSSTTHTWYKHNRKMI